MANKKKMTMVEQYNATIALLNGETVENYTVADAVAFLTGRAEQTTKKNTGGGGTRKPTKTQVENEGIKEQILEAIATEGRPLTVGEVMKVIGIDSNQKVTSLLTQLKKAEVVVRTEEKGVAYYGLPSAEVEE